MNKFNVFLNTSILLHPQTSPANPTFYPPPPTPKPQSVSQGYLITHQLPNHQPTSPNPHTHTHQLNLHPPSPTSSKSHFLLPLHQRPSTTIWGNRKEGPGSERTKRVVEFGLHTYIHTYIRLI